MSGFEINFRLEVGTPRTVWMMKCRAVLPYVPRVDDEIAPLLGDSFHTVEQVFWSSANGIEVYFSDEKGSPGYVKFMQSLGWKKDQA